MQTDISPPPSPVREAPGNQSWKSNFLAIIEDARTPIPSPVAALTGFEPTLTISNWPKTLLKAVSQTLGHTKPVPVMYQFLVAKGAKTARIGAQKNTSLVPVNPALILLL